LKGRQAKDPVRKKEFFLLSYNLLESLTERFPQSSRIETLNEGMEVLETELNKLGNTLEY
jgi:hypothetical protein